MNNKAGKPVKSYYNIEKLKNQTSQKAQDSHTR
jgi:hypothetical protein